MKLINLNIYLNEKKIMLWNAVKKECSLFLMYAFYLLEVGFPVLRLGKGADRWDCKER